jgi:hypothetical protein
MIGLVRHGGKGARIASVGTDDGECALSMQSGKAEQAEKKRNELDRDAKLAQLEGKRPQANHLEREPPRFSIQNRQKQGEIAKRGGRGGRRCAQVAKRGRGANRDDGRCRETGATTAASSCRHFRPDVEGLEEAAGFVLDLFLEKINCVDKLLGAGWAAGNIDVDGDNLIDALQQSIVVEDSA